MGTVTRETTTLTAPEITQEHLDAVQFWYMLEKHLRVHTLLFCFFSTIEFVVEGIVVGEIIINARYIDFRIFNAALFSYSPQPFRCLIIPGGASTGGKGGLDYTKMSYEKVMDHIGLDY